MKDLYEFVAEKDQQNIKELMHRIEVANLLADEVDDLIFSKGKQITRLEWMGLKKKANRNKGFLVKVQKDPKIKVFLHLQENQELETALSKQLERSLIDAIDRITASINVIDDEIVTNKNVIPGLSVPERALISAYKQEKPERGQDIYNDWLYYFRRSNRIGTESDKYGCFSKKKTLNKANRIEKIIPYLPLPEQQTANDELKTLESNLSKAIENQSEI
jgi:hypothetical protein